MNRALADGRGEWLPVALSETLVPGGVMRVVHGLGDFVVWRGHDNRVRCFDNRCPHRGMRLSFGFVRGNHLNCLYHGWQYDGDGACRHIPAHPKLDPPKTLCVEVHPCCEFDGMVWFSPGDRPEDIELSFNGGGVRSLSIDCEASGLRAFLKTVGLPSLQDREISLVSTVVHEDAHRLVLGPAEDRAFPAQIVIAVQPVAADKTIVHVQTSPPLQAAEKKAISRWLERVRRLAEAQGAPEVPAPHPPLKEAISA